MTRAGKVELLGRYTEIGELCTRVRTSVKRVIAPFSIVLLLESAVLWYQDNPGAGAFALMAISSVFAMIVWSNCAIGLPLLPMMILQGLIIYGIPIVSSHETIVSYPASFILNAGGEVMLLNFAVILSWWLAMKVFQPARPYSHVLNEFNKSGAKGWVRLGFVMIVSATAFETLQGLNLLDAFYAVLPAGGDSILNALISVASASGFFLVSIVIGGSNSTVANKIPFWGLLILNSMISASGFLLAGAAANLITVAVGLFWGNGKLPWRYLTIIMVTLSFFNVGKASMRARYWGNEDTPAVSISFGQLPSLYLEWVDVSINAILENGADKSLGSKDVGAQPAKNQTLLDRIDNLQNLLFVMDAIDVGHVTTLHGDSYKIIPPLLVPRVLWPNKPRSHEGQVMLNVHFGRQDLEDTFKTYIAWGLLPEAYGNFGAVTGSVVLGVFLGILFALIENLTARKLVVSTEGFISLALLMNLMNSFEMVASVAVTSTFQSVIIILAASMPFVRKIPNQKLESPVTTNPE